MGVDDEVWSLQMQGLLVPPSRTETTTGDSKMHIMSCTVDTVLYSPVQSRTVPCTLAALSTGNVSALRYHAIPMI